MSTLHSVRLGVPGARPAVLAHCFLGHSGAWPRLIAALKTPLDAVAFDLPGHGRSPPWDGQSDPMSVVADAFGDFADAPALLIGHSFGGAAALHFAVAHPHRVTGLVLIEPVFFAAAAGEPEFTANRAAEAAMHAAFQAGDMPRAAAAFFAVNGDAAGWAAMSDRLRTQVLGLMPMLSVSLPRLHHDGAAVLAPGRLEGLRLPILLLDGARSPAIFGAVNRALARRLPRARRITVPDAGHMLPITHPQPVADLIDGWIASECASEGRQTPGTRAG